MHAAATSWLWLAQLGSTLPLVGLIWFVQLVAYPLFAQAGGLETNAFLGYHQAHSRRITWIVLPLMLTELLAAGGWLWLPPPGVPRSVTWVGFALVVVVWLATAFVSVPRHEELARGFDARAQQRLVTTNWIRTCCWTARGIVLLWLLKASV